MRWKTRRGSKMQGTRCMAMMIIFVVVVSSLVLVAHAETPTVVMVVPASQTVDAGGSVVVTVNCSPARPVKGFELKISFNPSILHAGQVTEGDFFSGYTTFFSPGTINNLTGTIINVYDLVVGQGNVTSNGSLVSITFTAVGSGTSAVTLSGVRLTNETEYINVSVVSGSITVPGGGSPPDNPPPVNPPTENLPPSTPVKPIGPAFVEMGALEAYASFAMDPDGGRVRLRFDWGDGTLSEWSEFVDSNTSVSSSHSWSNISSYSVRAIAQDELGANSSWSEPLSVVVSQAEAGNQSPIALFMVPPTIVSNESVVFDASGSVDPDGMIVSYMWDFGDGTQGTGRTATHVYQAPGEYTVILTVTDDTGRTNSVSMVVTVAAGAPGLPPAEQTSLPSYLPMLVVVGVLGVLAGFVVVFREPLRRMLSRGQPVPAGGAGRTFASEVAEVEQLLDSLFSDIKQQAMPISKESLLDAYCDLIIENVEANPKVRLPKLNIAQVERIVDENYHEKVKQKIDTL